MITARTRRPSREAGFTLVEMLIASTLGLIVIGAAMTVLVISLKSEPRSASHASAVQKARTAMSTMTRELRQGSSVPTATGSQLSIVTYVDQATCGGAYASTAILCRVTYNCSAGSCTRSVAPPGGGASGAVRQVVSGLAAGNVFSYGVAGGSCTAASATGPTSVCVTFSMPAADGRNAITLSDGVAMRNA